MNDIEKTEKKCVQCGANFVLDTDIIFYLHKLDRMMQGSEAWWKSYQDLCDNCFKKIYDRVNRPDISIMDGIEKHPEYKKLLKEFGINSIAQLKEMGKACKKIRS